MEDEECAWLYVGKVPNDVVNFASQVTTDPEASGRKWCGESFLYKNLGLGKAFVLCRRS